MSRSNLNWYVRFLKQSMGRAADEFVENYWHLFTEHTVEEFLSMVLTVLDDLEHYKDEIPKV